MRTEKQIWDHYRDYVIEAARITEAKLAPVLSDMKKKVAAGCERQELKEMMLGVFRPITIMQSLEQWQNQMDIMLYTGVDELSGDSRMVYYSEKRNTSPYTFMADGISDEHDADTPIYELSGMTQDLLHMSSEHTGKEAPALVLQIMKEGNLEKNYEIQMLLGDVYRQCGQINRALEVYDSLWEQNGHADPSIQDAIMFTRYVEKIGYPRKESENTSDWLRGFGEYKKAETFRRSSRKISRNEPCPCGSGKKYKQCCGKNRGVEGGNLTQKI